MPPTCTPEKKNEYQNERVLSESNELYFTTKNYNILTSSELYEEQEDIREDNQINELTKTFPDLDRLFTLHKQVGFGTFSTVYLASLKTNVKKQFALKHIIPTCHPDRIKFELQCLKDVGGVDNVAGINLCLRNKNDIVLIMPYQPHDFFNNYVGLMDVKETACYMKNLLIAIAGVHSFGIVHRDVKPSNFLYDRENKKFMLVDFGLAHSVITKSAINDKKRKRDMVSPVSNDLRQPAKKLASNTNMLSRHMSTSQKENDPDNNKQKDHYTCTEASKLKQGQSRKKSEIIFTKSPPVHFKDQQNENPCKCYGKPRTCNVCITRKALKALRAGTPGFRPPEVLLKSNEQDTGIDIWAAGVIMLCILSNCCNFFVSPDDMTALAEIMTVFGSQEIKKVANQLGRYLTCSEYCPALDVRKICCTLRTRDKLLPVIDKNKKCKSCKQPDICCFCIGKPLNDEISDEFSDDAYDLLSKLLDINVKTRISAAAALNHPFLKNV